MGASVPRHAGSPASQTFDHVRHGAASPAQATDERRAPPEAMDADGRTPPATGAGPGRQEEAGPDFTRGIQLLARLARVAEQACQRAGISLPQYRLLLSVAEEPMRAGQVAERVGVSRPTLTSLIDGLERGGLLERQPVPGDRRGIRLAATEAGLTALKRAEAELTQRLVQLVDPDMARRVGDIVVALGVALDKESSASRD